MKELAFEEVLEQTNPEQLSILISMEGNEASK